jgi:galactonate dehydratase
MKITGVSTIVVGARMRNWIFVKLTTDDDGLVGWGEATTEWKTRSVVAAVHDLEPLVIGRDPHRIEDLWQTLWRGQFWPPGIVTASAISGIDQAAHDIKAKDLGIPLYDLIGGAVRDHIRVYDHLEGGAPDEVYADARPERFAELAARSVAAGFTAVKILPLRPGTALPTGAAVRCAGATMEAVRSAVGDDVDVMVDLHGRAGVDGAIQVIRTLAPYRPFFVEEPVPPHLAAGLPRIAAEGGVPLATGERLVGRAQFAALFQHGGVAVIQPDVCHCGGVAEVRRIAALAETHGVLLAPHNPLGPVATAHNLHVAAATPNFLIQEQMRGAAPWWNDIVTAPFEVVDGRVALPTGIGLGLEVDEREAARHPFEPEDQRAAARLDDGSLTDW